MSRENSILFHLALHEYDDMENLLARQRLRIGAMTECGSFAFSLTWNQFRTMMSRAITDASYLLGPDLFCDGCAQVAGFEHVLSGSERIIVDNLRG